MTFRAIVPVLFTIVLPVTTVVAVQDPDTRDPGAYIAGVKTLEGDPAGGLPYRLRMNPRASAESPDKVIVWFHPPGRSMNRIVEAMSPSFVRHGFALLVATRKSFDGWTDLDIGRMMNITLKEVGRIEGIDAERPVLMGSGPGGQTALGLWFASPRRYAGLIVDSAYPVRLESGSWVTREPPEDRAAQSAPVYALVGADDELAASWKDAETSWRAAGVPLTVQYVAGKGHGWLLDGRSLPTLERWLARIGSSPVSPEDRSSD